MMIFPNLLFGKFSTLLMFSIMDRYRRDEDQRSRSSKKASEAEQSILNRVEQNFHHSSNACYFSTCIIVKH